MSVRRLLVRRRLAPGMYVVEHPNAARAWAFLQWVSDKPSTDISHFGFANYGYCVATDERFCLPASLMPDVLDEDLYPFRFHRYGVNPPSLEIVRAELTEGSQEQMDKLTSSIAENAAALSAHNSSWTLSDWSEAIGAPVRKRSRIPEAIQRKPAGLLENGHMFGSAVDLANCQTIIDLAPVSGDDCILLALQPTHVLLTRPVGERYTRFCLNSSNGRSCDIDISARDLEEFAPLWEAGDDVTGCRRTAASFLLPQPACSTTQFPLRLSDLQEMYQAPQQRTWRETMQDILRASADAEYAASICSNPLQTYVLRLEVRSNGYCASSLHEETDWRRHLDFLKVAHYLHLVQGLPSLDLSLRSCCAVCVMTPGREGNLLQMLDKPNTGADCILLARLANGININEEGE